MPYPRSRTEVTCKDIIFSRASVVFCSIFNRSFRECDAIIGTTSYIYESASLDAMKQGFSDMQKEVHILGPLLPAGYGTEPPKTEEGVNSDIEAFLAEMLKRHGKRSVFFVRPFLPSRLQLQNFTSGFLWYTCLAPSLGICWWVDRSPHPKERTICTWQLLYPK